MTARSESAPEQLDRVAQMDTVAFLSWSTRTEQWELGVANGFTEGITLHTGDFEGDALVLRNARRPRGGAKVSFTWVNARSTGSDAMEVTLEESLDFGATWQPTLVRSYSRRSAPCDLLARDEGVDSPNLDDTPPFCRCSKALRNNHLRRFWKIVHAMAENRPLNGGFSSGCRRY